MNTVQENTEIFRKLQSSLTEDKVLYDAFVASIESALKELLPRIDMECAVRRIADRIIGVESDEFCKCCESEHKNGVIEANFNPYEFSGTLKLGNEEIRVYMGENVESMCLDMRETQPAKRCRKFTLIEY